MKFRTEIQIAPLGVTIGHENRLLTLGSCFSEHIAGCLARAKFTLTANPTGILFNPLSIASAIRSFGRRVEAGELHQTGVEWFHYDFHGSFSAPTAEQALEGMNAARQAGREALCGADRILLTFGTAWVFEHRGEVVANCHKQPAAQFTRRRLSVAEIVAAYGKLLQNELAGKEIILTVSPVRHPGDGLEGNSVSKATLRLAVELLCEQHPNVHYFPSFEILIDDLRDYRFYADDMIHPSPQAIAYVWEKFSQAAFTPEAQRLLPEIEAIAAAANHRPRNPHSESHMDFCRRQTERIAALPALDFQQEAAYFRQCLEINS